MPSVTQTANARHREVMVGGRAVGVQLHARCSCDAQAQRRTTLAVAMRVSDCGSGRSGAIGEAALPCVVALAYPADAANFPRILLAAGGVQACAFGIAWLAGLELVRRDRARQSTTSHIHDHV